MTVPEIAIYLANSLVWFLAGVTAMGMQQGAQRARSR